MDKKLHRLQQITGNLNFELWYFDKVINPEKIINFKYYKAKKEIKKVKINPKLIVGSFHASYNKYNWFQMLGYLHRNKEVEKEKALATIDDYEISDKKQVSKINGKYYIGSGNHRLCFAKFLQLEEITVDVIEYEFESKRYQIESELEKRNIVLDSNNNSNWNIILNKRLIRINEEIIDDFFYYFDNYQISNKQLIYAIINKLMRITSNESFSRNITITKQMDFNFIDKDLKNHFLAQARICQK